MTPQRIFAEVAHLVEHLFEAQGVVGSSPTLGTKFLFGNGVMVTQHTLTVSF